MTEFSVGKYRVDIARSQIIANDTVVPMEPKVLQVLSILAKHQGEVVAHQVILDQVWPNTVVGANAIQRCIAQLRKAMADDAKTQAVIATHPKMGYSLLSEVQWPQPPESLTNNHAPSEAAHQEAVKTETIPTTHSKATIAFTTLVFVALLAIIAIAAQPTTAQHHLQINTLTALTATDNKELQPSYSPDGNYIAFQRFIDGCTNQLWARDLRDQQEYLLTEDVGIYGTPKWSPDGATLLFSSVTACSQHQQLEGCTELKSLSFHLAKSSPQATRQVLSCEEQSHYSPTWINNDQIAFISSQEGQFQVDRLTLSHNHKETLYVAPNKTLQQVAYSPAQQQLAITQHDKAYHFELVTLEPKTKATQTIELTPPDKLKYHRYWHLSWHPSEASFLTAAEKSLFTFDMSGEFTEYQIPAMQMVFNPNYHPKGDNIVASMGTFDRDIKQVNWQSHAQNTLAKQQTIARSTVDEFAAKYQPNGNKIAFISTRSGNQQLWLVDTTQANASPTQLSQFPSETPVSSFVWTTDGKAIIVNAGYKLFIVSTDKKTSAFTLPFEINRIYQAIDKQQVLIGVIQNNQFTVQLLNLESQQSDTLYVGNNYRAFYTKQQELYVIDNQFKLYQVIQQRGTPIDQFLDIKSTSIHAGPNNTLLITDTNGILWQYNRATNEKAPFLTQPIPNDGISDISLTNQSILLNQYVSIKKEIVVFE